MIELLMLLFALVVVVLFTWLSFYTSVNSGAHKFEQWWRKWLGSK
ncbi:MAG TPA: hypothetical protein PKE03_05395 [Bacteroidales bacterium]|nr:hypothetical protein [Bacteroidales bacterium]